MVTSENVGDDCKTSAHYRCWGHLQNLDGGGCQCSSCGFSVVKVSSDPWLTWRAPAMTTISSQKQLCGYVQSLESTCHITASAISHWANSGPDMSLRGALTVLHQPHTHIHGPLASCNWVFLFSFNILACYWVWPGLQLPLKSQILKMYRAVTSSWWATHASNGITFWVRNKDSKTTQWL